MSKSIATGPHGVVAVDATSILTDLRELIHSARRRVATVANTEQTLLYWRLGRRIANENLTDGRAEYGKQILATLSQELMEEFGARLHIFGHHSYGPVLRIFSGRADCDDTWDTIELAKEHATRDLSR